MLRVIDPRILRYGMAVLSVAVALLLTLILQPVLNKSILVIFFAAVAISNWYGGFKPGLLATILAVLVSDYFFIPPVHSVTPTSWENVAQLVVFIFVSVLINSLNTELRIARNRSQASLAKAEAARTEVTNILESITDAFVSFNDQWRCVYINEQALRLLHKTREQLIGKQVWEEVFPSIFEDRVYQKLHRAVNEQTTLVFEDFAHSIGLCLEIHAYPSVNGLAVYFRDVTERKRAEEERIQHLIQAQQNTYRLQRLAEISLTINSTLSLQERLQLLTEQSRETIGAHQSATTITVDENWAQAIHAVSISNKYAQSQGCEQKPNSSVIHALISRLQGSIRMTQAELESHPIWSGFAQEFCQSLPLRGWLAAPLINSNGKNIGLIQLSDKYEGEFTEEDETILVQMTQMASLAINNAHLYEESQRANRVKDEFLAMLSHELRSPLNAILGWSQVLRSGKLNPEITMRALETIERNAKLQTQLIEDLLDVSRILRGNLSLNAFPINPALPVEAAIETMRLAAEAKSIQILPVIESNIGTISGDSNRLQQIVWNLLSNAIKFTSPGGRVEIRVTAVGSQAQIQVSDTGKGISSKFLPYVFDYFRQADASITRNYGGLGLGLAIVRHLVELHGGTVGAESLGEGQGATFTVRFPLLKQQPVTHQIGSFNNPPNLNGVKVLVVDDDVDAREFLVFILEQHGAIAVASASATEALERLEQFQPNVLLSDIGMPGEDGYNFIRRVRVLKSPHIQQIPAIALTAYASNEDRNQALKAGFQRHIPKPVDPAELITIVANLNAGFDR
ncbi:hybrid sensor histidine kinase/response regulator [Calothrix sp. NIES-2098]|uniref:hybrid sensor histidine kinase/response regulator n=1 Tax=Calothrix sp. NIES-2098 TaxID=1954171 RepID=UPI000B5DCABE|nr:multi-sensor hybrid histidine kinase [Calothrix sp. NIES-2098]